MPPATKKKRKGRKVRSGGLTSATPSDAEGHQSENHHGEAGTHEPNNAHTAGSDSAGGEDNDQPGGSGPPVLEVSHEGDGAADPLGGAADEQTPGAASAEGNGTAGAASAAGPTPAGAASTAGAANSSAEMLAELLKQLEDLEAARERAERDRAAAIGAQLEAEEAQREEAQARQQAEAETKREQVKRQQAEADAKRDQAKREKAEAEAKRVEDLHKRAEATASRAENQRTKAEKISTKKLKRHSHTAKKFASYMMRTPKKPKAL
eukprot:g20498.t1